ASRPAVRPPRRRCCQQASRHPRPARHPESPSPRPRHPPHVPASPVAATERTKYRWAAKKISSIGTRLITLPAISSVHTVACAPWNVASPSGTVIWLVEVTAISGHRKLFHEYRNVSAARVASAGNESGSTILQSPSNTLPPA